MSGLSINSPSNEVSEHMLEAQRLAKQSKVFIYMHFTQVISKNSLQSLQSCFLFVNILFISLERKNFT